MQKIFFIIILLFSTLGYSQSYYAEEIKHSIENQDKIQVDSVARTLGYKGGDKIKVYVIFMINNEGEIHDIRARGPHKVFEDEGIRIVSEIPKLNPNKNLEDGESRKFTLPLTLVLETDAEKKRRLKKEEKSKRKSEAVDDK